ncbi:hypothetical protein Q7C_981 [Methylophaga frappieri]|uniref:Aminoglycoside phosphotransferase domain-containing protein n=1 Tax=Methylophaga frappieri (strain ATCC BAA-2434 / DSM 25690 / JAM7) TaxID=754477 RepID=I1YGV7_METFJ|nr:hypothetical protein [Methylophaga frappieri]AFJ02150.1 hypothetical protein Q7C_981 [Methylophaga frappieri]
MVNAYPALAAVQQRTLPVLTAPAIALPQRYADSTHQLWRCETVSGPAILKVCDTRQIRQSAFWQGMNRLFAMNFPASLNQMMSVVAFLQQHGRLAIPECLAASAKGFMLSRFLNGNMPDESAITAEQVRTLARHITALHQQTFSQWGNLAKPTFAVDKWPIRLWQTIQYMVEHAKLTISPTLLDQVWRESQSIRPAPFVAVMPDLRWDQFLVNDAELYALVDLDAYVIAPKTLELVLLEFVLTSEQARLFKEVYCETHEMPDLSTCRLSYRLLLFLMHVLGETDLDKWLSQPNLFDES